MAVRPGVVAIGIKGRIDFIDRGIGADAALSIVKQEDVAVGEPLRVVLAKELAVTFVSSFVRFGVAPAV